MTPQEQAAVTFIKGYWPAHPDWAKLKSVTTTAWFAGNDGHELNAPGGSYGPMSQTLTMRNVDGTWRVSDSGQPAS